MDITQQSKQLMLNFQETLEVPLSSSSEMSIAADYSQHLTENQQLLEMILERANMWAALKRVRQNKGAPGVDGMTVDQAGRWRTVVRHSSRDRPRDSAGHRTSPWLHLGTSVLGLQFRVPAQT